MRHLIDSFKNRHILVVGDVMLDKFLFGEVSRINPEAPVPVLQVKRTLTKVGGAANVAANIVSLGGRCTLVGRVGNDEEGRRLIDELEKQNINQRLLISDKVATTTKTRTIAMNQQLLRIDFEGKEHISSREAQLVLKNIRTIIADIDLIIVSDYDKGLFTAELMAGLKALDKKIIADIKPDNKSFFKDVYLITPNLAEARLMSGIKRDDDDGVCAMGQCLGAELGCHVLITRSDKGMSLFELGRKPKHVPTQALEIYDVTGAGDTVISVIGLAIASDVSLEKSVTLANHAAGIVVGKMGTATVTPGELSNRLEHGSKKIKDAQELKSLVGELHGLGKKIVFTNGCYDIIHVGHLQLLKEAKRQGDVLVVGLNTDASIRRIKGPDRPINSQRERGELVASLEFVDYVTFFDENTPENIVGALRCDVHVKGGDYDPSNYEKMPEARVVHQYGGRVHIVKLIEGKSTTNIISKLNLK